MKLIKSIFPAVDADTKREMMLGGERLCKNNVNNNDIRARTYVQTNISRAKRTKNSENRPLRNS